MKRQVLALIVFLAGVVFCTGSAAGGSLEKDLAEIDSQCKKNYIAGNLRKSLELSRKLSRENPGSYEVWWRYARSAFFVANRASSDREKSKAGYEGYEAALKAQKIEPQRADAWYWGACSLGEYGRSCGILNAVTKGIATKIRDQLEKAVKYNRRLNHGGPLVALGRYWYRLPWPMKDIKKSIGYLAESVKVAPYNLRNHAYLADAYFEDGKISEAKKHYTECAGGDQKVEQHLNAGKWKKYCARRLEEISTEGR